MVRIASTREVSSLAMVCRGTTTSALFKTAKTLARLVDVTVQAAVGRFFICFFSPLSFDQLSRRVLFTLKLI
jgi:SNF2 family DNA or RNA helicase